ncbi:MAG: VWA domain-containing protein [Puniceicoccales bacterium]|jgi:uncharacterized protein (DUF58 family)|nr:VWA domain-containing protein [Puniceicoccales bacterium]
MATVGNGIGNVNMVLWTKSVLSKLYRKFFCPSGVVLGDAREYVAGDDTRLINWHVTAKTNALSVNTICADSGNDIIFALDVSESMKFGTKKQPKISLATDILKTLSQLSETNNDRMGLVAFSHKVEKYFPPRRRAKCFQYAIDKMIHSNERLRTDLAAVLGFLNRVLAKRSRVILVCDTFAMAVNRKTILSQLHILKSRHDVIMLPLVDDNDMLKARLGRITVEDSETGEIFEMDTNDIGVMSKIETKYSTYQKLIFKDVENVGIKIFPINTRDSAAEFLFKLFK